MDFEKVCRHIEKFMVWLCRITIGSVATSGMRYHLGGMQISENFVILRNAWDQTSQVLNRENKIV